MENRETEHTILDREEYIRGYRDGHKDGFEAGRNSVTLTLAPWTIPITGTPAACSVCGAPYPFGCQSAGCPNLWPNQWGVPYITSSNLGGTPEVSNDGG